MRKYDPSTPAWMLGSNPNASRTMPELTTTISLVIAAVGCLFILAGVLPWLRRKPRRFCPGPRQRWFAWLLPTSWLAHGRCRYDLTGSLARESQSLRCPECGAVHRSRRRLLRSERRIRLGRIGALVVLVAAFVHGNVHWRWRDAVTFLPTPPLLMAETYLDGATPGEVFYELRERADNGSLNEEETDRMVELLVRDLRDDNRRDNADRAMDLLGKYARQGHPNAERALLDVLKSDDWQQRQLALSLLQRLRWNQPTDDMLDVAMEAMLDDGGEIPFNGHSSKRFLIANADRAAPWIKRGLQSSDVQQRLFCAIAAGEGKLHDLLPMAAPILAWHLRDNDIWRDEGDARRALEAFGVDVLPYVEPLLESDDEQQARLAKKIVDNVKWRDYLDRKRAEAETEPSEP